MRGTAIGVLMMAAPVYAEVPQACNAFAALDLSRIAGDELRFNYAAKAGPGVEMSGCEAVSQDGRRVLLNIWRIEAPAGPGADVKDYQLNAISDGAVQSAEVEGHPARWSEASGTLYYWSDATGLVLELRASDVPVAPHLDLALAVLETLER